MRYFLLLLPLLLFSFSPNSFSDDDNLDDQPCWTDNPLALSEFVFFDVQELDIYIPAGSNKVSAFGCVYDVVYISTNHPQFHDEQSCFIAELYRTDIAADSPRNLGAQVNHCELKTCSENEELDSNFICQPIEPVLDYSCTDPTLLYNVELNKCVGSAYIGESSQSVSFTMKYYGSEVSDRFPVGTSRSSAYFSLIGRFNSLISPEEACTRLIAPSPTHLSVVSARRFWRPEHDSMKSECSANMSNGTIKTWLTNLGSLHGGTHIAEYCDGELGACSYTCPDGGILEGDSCVGSSSVANNTQYGCPDGSTVGFGENCATKICGDGHEVGFSFACSTREERDLGECDPESKDYLKCFNAFDKAEKRERSVGFDVYTGEEKDLLQDIVDSKREDYKDELVEARIRLSDSVKLNFSSHNSPFFENIKKVKGVDIDFGTTRFQEFLAFLPALILFVASASAGYIILGGGKS
jgi:hypothetical protein